MESLFESLYTYALENRFDFYTLRDEKERQENETMIRHAMDELKAQGMDGAAHRIEEGFTILACLDRRGAFWAGLTMGLELNRL